MNPEFLKPVNFLNQEQLIVQFSQIDGGILNGF